MVTGPTLANLTYQSATLGGNVTSDGGSAITERGVLISKMSDNADPKLNDWGITKVTATGTTGVFTAPVTGLTAETAYSYRAYATTAAGTTYTSVATLTTPKAIDFNGVDDAAITARGETRIYPLANDVSPTGAPLRLVSVSNPAIVIDADGRSLIIPAGFSGTFTYTFSDGTKTGQASVTVSAVHVRDGDAMLQRPAARRGRRDRRFGRCRVHAECARRDGAGEGGDRAPCGRWCSRNKAAPPRA